MIEVNAWSTDYFDDASLAIFGELTQQLTTQGLIDEPGKIGLSELKECFAKVIATIPHVAGSLVNLTAEDVDGIIAALTTDAKKRLDVYEKQLSSVKEFRSKLKAVAQAIRNKTDKPLIVLIDELDRCRPTYAIRFMEVVKHLLAVDNMVYVFAMNRSELAHAVSGCYGPEFDGDGYLRRFFDVDFKLPLPPRRSFIGSILDELGLMSLMPDQDARKKARRLLHAFLAVDAIGLRQVQQALYRFRMALEFARLDTARFPNYVEEFCVALILRVYNPSMLGQFLRGENSDKEMVESLLPSTVKDDSNLTMERLWFESAIISAAQEIAGLNVSTQEYEPTPLLKSYEKFLASTSLSSNASEERRFATILVRNYGGDKDVTYTRGFKFAVEQLEVLELLIK